MQSREEYSDDSADEMDNDDDEAETEFAQVMEEEDEPALERLGAEDVALNMDTVEGGEDEQGEWDIFGAGDDSGGSSGSESS